MTNYKTRLSDEAPIIVTWIPRKLGASLPDGKNSELNYLDILINHKQKNKEDRDIYLVINGPGFNPGQIEELKDQLKEQKVDGIHVVDLYEHDWSEIDNGWKMNGDSISIKKYYKNMYNMSDKERTYFGIEVDTFRLVTLALLEQFTKQKGGIYIDFDSLSAIDDHIGKGITIPKGLLLGCIGVSFHNKLGNLLKVDVEVLELLQALGRNYESKVVGMRLNNDLIVINNPTTAVDILSKYKNEMLSQSQMCSEIKTRLSSITNEKNDQLATEWKEGIKKFILDIDNNGIKALYDITNFKYIVVDGVDMNIAQASTVNMIKAEKVGEYMQFSFTCNNGNYCQGKSDQSWMKEDLHGKEKNNKTSSHSTIQEDHQDTAKLSVNEQNVINKDSKIQLDITHVQGNIKATIDLFTAAKEGDAERAQEAILLGADVSAKNVDMHKHNDDGKTPLHFAAQYGHTEVLELLLKHDAKVDEKNNNNSTPLHFAAQEGHVKAVELLLKGGADVSLKSNVNDGYTALHFAALGKRIEVVKLLIQNNAKIDVVNENGNTPLIVAALRGHTDVTKFLIDEKANINAMDKNGYKALHAAAQSGNVDIAKLLVQNGANADDKSHSGYTALHFAALGKHIEVVKLLIQNMDDIFVKNEDGYTLPYSFTWKGDIEIVKLLINTKKFNVNDVTKYGYSLLHIAVFKGNREMVECLIENWANINNGDITPLMLAVKKRYIEIVELLLQKGADIHIKDAGGKTFLDLVKESQAYIPLLELVAEYKPQDVKDSLSNEPDLISKLSGEDKLSKKLKNIVKEVENTQNANEKESILSYFSDSRIEDSVEKSR